MLNKLKKAEKKKRKNKTNCKEARNDAKSDNKT